MNMNQMAILGKLVDMVNTEVEQGNIITPSSRGTYCRLSTASKMCSESDYKARKYVLKKLSAQELAIFGNWAKYDKRRNIYDLEIKIDGKRVRWFPTKGI
jgi:hypothetical protein